MLTCQSQPNAHRSFLRLPLPLQPHACYPTVRPRRERRPRCPQCLPGHRAQPQRAILHVSHPYPLSTSLLPAFFSARFLLFSLLFPFHRSQLKLPREASPAKPGDYFEFLAEIDILCALSTCPGGDLSAWQFGEAEPSLEPKPSHEAETTRGENQSQAAAPRKVEMVDTCRPIHVDVYKVLDETVLADWKPPSPPAYTGMHGLGMPIFKRARERELGEKAPKSSVEPSPEENRSPVDKGS